MVEERGHVGDGVGFAVEGWVAGVVGLAVAAHVPEDEPEVLGEGGDLAGPHLGGGGVAVSKD